MFGTSSIELRISTELRRRGRFGLLDVFGLRGPSLISKASQSLHLLLSLDVRDLFLHGWRIRTSLPEPLMPLRRDLYIGKGGLSVAFDDSPHAIVSDSIFELPERIPVKISACMSIRLEPIEEASAMDCEPIKKVFLQGSLSIFHLIHKLRKALMVPNVRAVTRMLLLWWLEVMDAVFGGLGEFFGALVVWLMHACSSSAS